MGSISWISIEEEVTLAASKHYQQAKVVQNYLQRKLKDVSETQFNLEFNHSHFKRLWSQVRDKVKADCRLPSKLTVR